MILSSATLLLRISVKRGAKSHDDVYDLSYIVVMKLLKMGSYFLKRDQEQGVVKVIKGFMANAVCISNKQGWKGVNFGVQ
jgi:hypothetical protein